MFTLSDGGSTLSEEETSAIIWIFTTVALLTTVVRLYVRILVIKAFRLDDFLALAGQVLAVAFAGLSHWHLSDVWTTYWEFNKTDAFSTEGIARFERAIDQSYRSAIIVDILHLMLLPVVKCSILAFYIRISPSKRNRYFIYLIAVTIFLQSTINAILYVFSYDPVSAWWHHSETKNLDVRFDHQTLQAMNSGFQLFFDAVMLALPLPTLWRTQLSKRKKAGLLVIYLISFLSVGVTIARLVRVAQFVLTDSIFALMERRIDLTYFAIIEIMTIIMCANLPAMPALVRHMGRSRAGYSQRSSLWHGYLRDKFKPLSDVDYSGGGGGSSGTGKRGLKSDTFISRTSVQDNYAPAAFDRNDSKKDETVIELASRSSSHLEPSLGQEHDCFSSTDAIVANQKADGVSNAAAAANAAAVPVVVERPIPSSDPRYAQQQQQRPGRQRRRSQATLGPSIATIDASTPIQADEGIRKTCEIVIERDVV